MPEVPPPGPRPAAGRTVYGVLWGSGLLNVLTLAGRDLRALLRSPVAYAVGALVIVPTSIFGYLMPVHAGEPVAMASVFNALAVSTVFLTPVVTGRLLAGEVRRGTLEELLASPVRVWELVVGKWLGGLFFFLAAAAFTLVYLLLLTIYQRHVDYGAAAAGYGGVVLLGGAWVALGLLASSLTGSQVTAAVSGILLLFAFEIAFGALAGSMVPPWSDALAYASAANRAHPFSTGLVELRDVVYFVTLTAGALFVAVRVVASRRWR